MQAEGQLQPYETTSTLRLISAAGAASIIGGSAVVAYFDPTGSNFFPVCPLFALTGFACPGCGLTRGFHALFHGDLLAAMDYNVLSPVWAIILGYVLISLVLTAIRGKGLPMWATTPAFLWVFLIVLATFGVLRNLPVYPFTFLFP
jgi:hypothetical protein